MKEVTCTASATLPQRLNDEGGIRRTAARKERERQEKGRKKGKNRIMLFEASD